MFSTIICMEIALSLTDAHTVQTCTCAHTWWHTQKRIARAAQRIYQYNSLAAEKRHDISQLRGS